jgi:dihydroflavonol-4-reductase
MLGADEGEPSMSRALITGANGFVGSNLARWLCAKGWQVRGLVRNHLLHGKLVEMGVELAPGQLDDPDSLSAAAKDVDYVFHLAGRVAALRTEDFFRDNVDGTRAMARACAAQPRVPTMVMVSSLAAGGPGTFKRPRVECDPEAPVSAYGRSKLAAEGVAAAVLGGGALSIVRPPMVFGQADKASLQLFRSMKFFPVHLSPGLRRFPLSLIHVTDLCDAIERVAERGERVPTAPNGASPCGAGRYYAAAERAVTYGQLGQLAAHAAGWAVVVAPVPLPVFWVAGGIGEITGRVRKRPTILNFDKVRETAAPGWVCSDEKIRRELGYKPAAILEERFAETVAWYREHKWL